MDGHVGTVAIRRFIPAATGGSCIVYAHGGGFQIGSLDSHHGVAASLAKLTSKEVISVDYRLAPEVGYDDMLTDWMQVIAALQPVALAGDSAGARLVMDAAYIQDCRVPMGLVYPLAGRLDEQYLGPDAPLLSREDVSAGVAILAASTAFNNALVGTPPGRAIELLTVEHDPLTASLEAAVESWCNAGA